MPRPKLRGGALALLLLLTTLLGGAACEGDDDDNLDQDGRRWPGTCDPVLQDCPTGQQCVGGCAVAGVMAKVFTCAVPAAGASATHGQDCGNGCARGHDCFIVDLPDGGTRAVCRKYCNVDADCATGRCADEGLICSAADPVPIGRVCTL